jgi:hypothetical protein
VTRLPRIALALLVVQLLQLLVPGAAAACSRVAAATGVETHAAGEHAGHGAPTDGQPGGERGEREMPGHCAVAPACAGVAATNAVVSIAHALPASAAVLRIADERLPRSPVSAPEPPPPRG